MSYTRAQLAAAVDAAHAALHDAEYAFSQGDIEEGKLCAGTAHEHLHTVGAGLGRVQECGTADPEIQDAVRHWQKAADTTVLPGCGHRFSDLIAGSGTVTKCGACLALRQASKETVPLTIPSMDPHDPLYRLRVEDGLSEDKTDIEDLITVLEEDMTSQRPSAQILNVRSAVDLTEVEVTWLRAALAQAMANRDACRARRRP